MGSTCKTCQTHTTPTTTTTTPTTAQPEFSKQIHQLVEEIRKKYTNQNHEARQFLLGGEKKYRGVIKNGEKSGYGELYTGRSILFGVFEKDRLSGEGLIVTDFKNYIKSNFHSGVANGQTKQKINRNYFHGQFNSGKKSKGILTTDQYLYEGSFKDNKFHGYGILQFENGDRYQGDFYEGVYHGDGVYSSREHGVYKGEFQNGVYEGRGSYFWGEEMLFNGEYKGGVRNGQGKLTRGDRIYEGNWVNGSLTQLQKQKPIELVTPPTSSTKKKPQNLLTERTDLTGYVIQLF